MRYLHIGFPKNFSTSLQRSYFCKHPDLYHLGAGTVESNIGYVDSKVERIMELYLRTCKDFKYNENKNWIKKVFNDHFNKAEDKGLTVGASNEHFSFSYSYDAISASAKANRLKEIFQDARIIIFLRSQKKMVESLYKESIRTGISLTFEDYINLFYKYQDRNYYYDLAYTNIVKLYQELFGKENVKVLFFENYRDENGLKVDGDGKPVIIEDLNKSLNIGNFDGFQHHNKALDSAELAQMLKINHKYRHNLGRHLLESPENHRIASYLRSDLEMDIPEKDAYKDVLIKRANIEKSKELKDSSNSLELNWPTHLESKILDFYDSDNRMLEKELGFDLCEDYFY